MTHKTYHTADRLVAQLSAMLRAAEALKDLEPSDLEALNPRLHLVLSDLRPLAKELSAP